MKCWEAGNTGRRATPRSVAEGGNLNDRAGTRTQDQRINLPQIDLPKTDNPKGLRLHGEGLAHHLPIGTNQADADPNLTAIIEAWPGLPEAVKAALVAMVKAVKH